MRKGRLFKIATYVFFGWLVLDLVTSLLGVPIEGIYYSGPASPKLAVAREYDWRTNSALRPFLFLVFFSSVWLSFKKFFGSVGTTLAAFLSSFVIVSFVVVPLVTADIYDLTINYFWSISMFFCSTIFFFSIFFHKNIRFV